MATRATPIKPKDIAINLDVVEREDKKGEFAAVINERRIVFIDAADIEWDVLETMDTPSDFVNNCTSKEDREFIYDQKLPAWKFKMLWEAYQAHFGMTSRGNARA